MSKIIYLLVIVAVIAQAYAVPADSAANAPSEAVGNAAHAAAPPAAPAGGAAPGVGAAPGTGVPNSDVISKAFQPFVKMGEEFFKNLPGGGN